MNLCNCETCKNHICAKKVPIFSFLSDQELLEIMAKIHHREYLKGERIILEHDISHTLYIINEGKVKLSKILNDGKEQIVHILSSGDFFGELNLFTENAVNHFSASAITDVKLCTLNKEDMDQILMKNPKISLKILSEVTKKLHNTENLAQNLATSNVEVRIAYMLLEFVEKYGNQLKDGIKIECPITREEMANYIGITRETMSRKLKKFETSGIIQLKGYKTIIINDINALENYYME